MPIDPLDIRENTDAVRESQRKRGLEAEQLVDLFLAQDSQVRDVQHDINGLRGQINTNSKKFGKLMKTGESTDQLAKETRDLKDRVAQLEVKVGTLFGERANTLNKIGNLVHPQVPVSFDEADNRVMTTWGKIPEIKEPFEHPELMERLGMLDSDRGTKVAGHRGYFLKGWGLKMSYALNVFALGLLETVGYELIQTPYLMVRELMAKTAQLEDFDEMLYKVGEGDDEKYLIATSEQPLSALYAEEWMVEKDLPIRYAGSSTCFRKEAGSGGRDQRGIFRVHQFEKVEQFVITKPEDSWEEHKKMLSMAEAFYQALGLPYQVIDIVSGALNNAASRKYDLEGWFPGQGKYRELVSCSNCTDYQSRALEVRCGAKVKGEKRKRYVHMLNCTMMANTRTICCILENYQTDEGVRVPEAIQELLGTNFIPFVR